MPPFVFDDRPYPVVNIIADQVKLGKLGVEACFVCKVYSAATHRHRAREHLEIFAGE